MQAWEEKVLGEKQAREEGKIIMLIENYIEFGKSTEEIIKRLMERFRMSEKEAQECIAEYERGEH